MGSFNVGCGLSGLSIDENDRVGFVLLNRSRLDRSLERIHFYSTDLFTPALPPVYGIYGDYGNVEDLETSPVTALMEEVFRRPAQEVVNLIGRGGSVYSPVSELVPLYALSECQPIITNFQSTLHDLLLVTGFTAVAPTEGFNCAYEFQGHLLQGMEDARFNGSTWTITFPNGREPVKIYGRNGAQVMDAFAKTTGLYPGIAQEDWHAVASLTSAACMFFHADIYDGVKQVLENSYDSLDDDAYSRAQFERLHAAQADVARLSVEVGAGQWSIYPWSLAQWQPILKHLDFDTYREASVLGRVMTGANRMFMPSFNGEQFGNNDVSRALLAAATKVVDQRFED